jgi:hypothetical protein
VIHFRADDSSAHGVPERRVPEIYARYAERMLGRLLALDERPLAEERLPPAPVSKWSTTRSGGPFAIWRVS